MKSVGWRALLLSLCAIVGLVAAADIFLQYGGPNSTSFVGQWGYTVGASAVPFPLVVLSTDPGHGADGAIAELRTAVADLRELKTQAGEGVQA